MPTLPLFDRLTADRPDAWRRVRAPGGYEWWHFHAQDPPARLHLTITFFQGYPFHPQYVRRYFAYRAHPTRRRPPQPAEYPAVHLAVYQNDKLLAQTITQYPPAMFQAFPDTSGISIGPSRFSARDGILTLDAHAPDKSLCVNLAFRDCLPLPPSERIIFPAVTTGAEHHWIVEKPLCDVSGQIRLAGKNTIEFAGQGSHDHCYGSGLLEPGLTRWMSGRVLLPNQALAFQCATPRSPEFPEAAQLLWSDRSGTREISSAPVKSSWDRKTAWGLDYPSILDIGPALLLRRPRLLHSSAFSLHAQFDAYVDGQQTTAFCRIVYPRRLRLPVVGRWIERAIHHNV